jgi:hypothetical protein
MKKIFLILLLINQLNLIAQDEAVEQEIPNISGIYNLDVATSNYKFVFLEDNNFYFVSTTSLKKTFVYGKYTIDGEKVNFHFKPGLLNPFLAYMGYNKDQKKKNEIRVSCKLSSFRSFFPIFNFNNFWHFNSKNNQNYFEFYISKDNPSFKLSNAHYKVDFNKQISNFIINKSYAIYQFDKINDIKILYNDNYLLLNALKDDYLRVRFRDNQLYIYETQPFSEKQYSNPDIIQSMFTDYLYNSFEESEILDNNVYYFVNFIEENEHIELNNNLIKPLNTK